MATKKHKRSRLLVKNYLHPLFVAAVVVLVAVAAWLVYEATHHHNLYSNYPPNQTKAPYVDGNQATAHVANFYTEYIKFASRPDLQKNVVASFGDDNLVFYDQYYRHGFDPITCTTVTPVSVSASLISTGPVATVKVVEKYADHTTQTLTARVLVTTALRIDSITCPGAKGNLPPA